MCQIPDVLRDLQRPGLVPLIEELRDVARAAVQLADRSSGLDVCRGLLALAGDVERIADELAAAGRRR